MPLKNSILTFLIFVVTCVHFTSCVDDELQAEDSLEGVWNVTEIFSLYGEFFPTGFNSSSNLTEEGALGYFNFNENNVAYSFTRNDTLYSGNMDWNLDIEKRTTGFATETFTNLRLKMNLFLMLFLKTVQITLKIMLDLLYLQAKRLQVDMAS